MSQERDAGETAAGDENASAEEEGETNRAGLAEVLREGLAGLDSSQGACSASVVGEGLNVDRDVALVVNNGLLGGSTSGGNGSASEDGRQLHLCGLGWFVELINYY